MLLPFQRPVLIQFIPIHVNVPILAISWRRMLSVESMYVAEESLRIPIGSPRQRWEHLLPMLQQTVHYRLPSIVLRCVQRSAQIQFLSREQISKILVMFVITLELE